MLYVDQRGTGLSTPVDADVLAQWRSVEQQAAYLKLFRADNIVLPSGGMPPVVNTSFSPSGLARVSPARAACVGRGSLEAQVSDSTEAAEALAVHGPLLCG